LVVATEAVAGAWVFGSGVVGAGAVVAADVDVDVDGGAVEVEVATPAGASEASGCERSPSPEQPAAITASNAIEEVSFDRRTAFMLRVCADAVV
jgi:hypothetical protein